jgi:hypothetical protein
MNILLTPEMRGNQEPNLQDTVVGGFELGVRGYLD